MWKNRKVAVVVPAYNEAENIFETLTTIPKWVDLIFVVNDCSLDDTDLQIQSAIKYDARINNLLLKTNSGVGAAIKEGYKNAIDAGADICAVMAGDGQMDPLELHKLVDRVASGQVEMAKGNRFYSSKSTAGMPSNRVLGNILFSLLTKIGSGYWSILDPQNGYVAVSVESIKDLHLDSIANRYNFENDFLCHMRMIDARIADVNIPARYRNETSTIKMLPTIIRISSTLFKGFWRRMFVKHFLWSFSLIPLFLLLGILSISGGLFLGVLILGKVSNSVSPSAGTSSLDVILITSGVQFLLTSLIMDVISEPKASRFNQFIL